MPSVWRSITNSIAPHRESIRAAAITQTPLASIYISDKPPPCSPSTNKPNGSEKQSGKSSENSSVKITTASKPKLSKLDIVTRFAGSNWVLGGMLIIIIVWIFSGIFLGTTDEWQVMMQNASSVQVYITDILLLRQSINASRSALTTLAELRSRIATSERLIRQIPSCQWMETHREPARPLMRNGKPVEEDYDEAVLLGGGNNLSYMEYVWGSTCRIVAMGLGSLWAYLLYWIGVIVWVALGPTYDFSDVWQLYVNTATAVALTFTSAFLQNIEQQQEDRLDACLEHALRVDAEVEYRLREITNDSTENPVFEISPPKLSKLERMIDVFALFMGSMWGIYTTLIVAIAWIAFGPMLKFGNDWTLIIGTFTGLIGFIDGFVLRNIYHREQKLAAAEFEHIATEDGRLLDLLNIPPPYIQPPKPATYATQMSLIAGEFCALASVSIAAVGVVCGLLITATLFLWSTTGQLLCNTPTMIIEGFLLLILIQAHNTANSVRGMEISGLLKRRLILNYYVCQVAPVEEGKDEFGIADLKVPMFIPQAPGRPAARWSMTSRACRSPTIRKST